MMIRRKGDWLWAKAGAETVMMSAAKGNCIGLTPVGGRIWELLEEPRSVDEICVRLVKEFRVTPEECRRQVETFLLDLETHDAITRYDQAATGSARPT